MNDEFNWLIALVVIGALVALGAISWLIAMLVIVVAGAHAGINS